ncbi:MAG: leucine--tRNA ligase [Saprospiraceae bacterium]|nr:leucine--tRNA ligase [Candidatus Vicinibacter affinis]
MDYNHREVEKKWKKNWLDNQVYKVEDNFSKPKYYVLDMFPYPSGSGLHVGHPLGYIASDIFARHKKMSGYNVLHPMGFDAFGLPAEQYAIQTGVHPAKSTMDNIQRYRDQLSNIGLNYDWSREVITCNPSYYRWTQWIFLKLFKHYFNISYKQAKPIEELVQHFETKGSAGSQAFGLEEQNFSAKEWLSMSALEKSNVLMNYRLAYRKESFVNWCEGLGTVLANDEIKDGVSERGGFPVEKKPMTQWALRISAYAERLLNDLDTLEWSDALKTMQKNWIGKSTGAQIYFKIKDSEQKLEIFTTRPDTIFGVSFMVIAPEHELVNKLTTASNKNQVEEYLEYVNKRSDRERLSDIKTVTGVFTGSYAINPISGKTIPIWISEYVLIEYGTGAIMAVPGHDLRDQAFATKFNLPILTVVDQSAFPSAGPEDKLGHMINSDLLDGLLVKDAIDKIIREIERLEIGKEKVQYRMRDANFSRQRYWGEPFPVYYDNEGVCHPIEESELPLILPQIDQINAGTGGKSPLAAAEEWVNFSDGKTRETDTMPGYAGSSWYFLRYMDPTNSTEFASKNNMIYWQDVDLYIGGTEHAVGHLMYARFWHKFLNDLGYVPTIEPFKKLVNQGMIQGMIESLCLVKESQPPHFISTEITKKYLPEQLAFIPVHKDFVMNYGSNEAHLNIDGVLKFIEWRTDYSNAIFENENFKGSYKELPTDFRIKTKTEVGKMSKRYHNVVNPDDVVEEYGADCFRMYEMFLGPIEDSKPWDTKGISGVAGFLKKYYQLFFGDKNNFNLTDELPTSEELKILHTCIKKVNNDVQVLSFNTSVSAFMICVNELRKLNCNKKEILLTLNKLLAPFAPFITEEIHFASGGNGSVHHQEMPLHDEKHLTSEEINYPVSVNGKKRCEWLVLKTKPDHELMEGVLLLDEIKKWVEGQSIKKIIIVPGRMINIVL